jgi:hypothetical protein
MRNLLCNFFLSNLIAIGSAHRTRHGNDQNQSKRNLTFLPDFTLPRPRRGQMRDFRSKFHARINQTDLHLLFFGRPQEKFSRTNQYTDPIPFAFQVMGRPARDRLSCVTSGESEKIPRSGGRSLEDRRPLSPGVRGRALFFLFFSHLALHRSDLEIAWTGSFQQ